MARVKFSALISDCRGKTGDIVFSSWKGRPVVRTRVTPANPDSVNQQRIREHMALIVSWWHFLSADMQADCKLLAAGESISGFNAFTKRNVRDLEMVPTPIVPRIMPLNARTNLISGFEATTGAVGGKIALTWTAAEEADAEAIQLLAVKTDEELEYDKTMLELGTPVTVASEAYTLEDLEPETEYTIFAMTSGGVVPAFSMAENATATSSAAA
jgi:hypothetical protein